MTTTWNSDTLNCTDPSTPMNAWGMGLPQEQLRRIKSDPTIVALAVQEAWHCASPENINSVLAFKKATNEQEGVALLARFGMRGQAVFQRIDTAHNRWMIGGDVCLDAACSASVPMFSTHFGGTTDDDFPGQADRLLLALHGQQSAHLFMGDLNLFRIDQWNPEVPCTAKDSPGRVNALDIIERAGYTDAWKSLQKGEGWTGMASRRGCGSPAGSLYKRIDYVFTKGLRAISVTRFGQAAPGADAPSDHAGLITEIASGDQRSR
jgi:endonuclease/exonuclease/phosphatase family metal-dependent hydrolase